MSSRDFDSGLDALALTNLALPDGLYVLPAELARPSGSRRAGRRARGWGWLRRAIGAARRWYFAFGVGLLPKG